MILIIIMITVIIIIIIICTAAVLGSFLWTGKFMIMGKIALVTATKIHIKD